MRTAVVLLVVVILFCLAPLGGVIVASAIADHAGCTLNEGSVNPCVIWGKDRGETLYTLFVMGWFMLATLPVAALATVALAALGLFALWRHLRAGT